jgi:hypothetical protein
MIVKFEKVKGLSIVIGIFLIIFILLATFLPEEPPEEAAIRLAELRRSAYDEAVECSNTTNPALSYEQISWMVVPGNKLVFNTTEGKVVLQGWFSPKDSTIYIPETNKETYWILLHESLHAIGYLGHPNHPFRTCNALPEQN